MATHNPTAPARAGERSRASAASLYARPEPVLEPEDSASDSITSLRPDTPHVRALRFLDATGELIAAALIIGGGLLAYGHLVTVA